MWIPKFENTILRYNIIKYLGIYLRKLTEDQWTENYKMVKEITEDLNKLTDICIHGLENST